LAARSRFCVSFGTQLDLDLIMGEGAPAASQALVIPQDVHLVMGDVRELVETGETPEQVLNGPSYRPCRLGSVLLRAASQTPLLLQAVVYDFARTPPATADHVFGALVISLEEGRKRAFTSLAVRPLGTAHGGLDPEAFLRLLTQTCHSAAELGTSLRRVSLMLASPGEMASYEALLHQLVERRGR